MPSSSVLEQYQVADFIEWWKQKRLTINQDFQRRAVWTDPAKSYLIQTILRQMPMPKVYLRTLIDRVSQASVREIVDGQQRLRAILDFGLGKFRLTSRAGEFSGLYYSDLEEELQNTFLSYRISVEQLINADDDDVLEVFARLNSYTVPLNPPELRHARYQGDFKWKVRETTLQLAAFYNKHNVLATRERVRMLDDSLTAELFGVILEGVKDGGQPKITRLYETYDKNFPQAAQTAERVLSVVDYADDTFGELIDGTPFSSGTHFLMLFAAIAHAKFGIPNGDIRTEAIPDPKAGIDGEVAKANLAVLALAMVDPPDRQSPLLPFVDASSASTQRIASRSVRFLTLYGALSQPL